MFILIVMMTATACSEPEIVPTTKIKHVSTSSTQTSNHEFHSTVVTWTRPDGRNYVGPVQSTPEFDLSKSKITVVGNGITIRVDTFLDVTKLSNTGSNADYFWASIQNNILILNYVGATTTSVPPFPLDVIIVY